jgi:tripartite-type tricarboxylate transporter receptor subunit TctC
MTRTCFTLLSVLGLVFASGEARAQAWPTRPVRSIVAFSAGGIVDVMARVVCDQLSTQFRQPVIVENVPVRERRSPPPLSPSRILMDIPS